MNVSPRADSGQAAVESALTLPLTVFLVLGALQLFMLMQARIMAQYAVSRAAHMGAVNNANCHAMVKSAIAVVMPAINAAWARPAANGVMGTRYANEVKAHFGNLYLGAQDGDRTGPIIWIYRVQPLKPAAADLEEDDWNLPPPDGTVRTLELRMVFWAPLKIPFANWVFARLALASWGLDPLHSADPLMPAKKDANWVKESNGPSAQISTELQTRYDKHEYVFPVMATYATHMMSPPRFVTQDCQ